MSRTPLVPRDADPAWWFRRFLVGASAVVYAGAGVDLTLLGHVEGWLQRLPFGAVAVGLAAALWWWFRPSGRADLALRATGVLAVVTAATGIGLHGWGNYALEREVNASAGTAELLGAALTGGTPLLAPALLALAGVLAAAATTRRHATALPRPSAM